MKMRPVERRLWSTRIHNGKVDVTTLPTRFGYGDESGKPIFEYLCGVYVVYGDDGDRPLYVGMGVDVTRRLVNWSNRRGRPEAHWWPNEGRVTVLIPEVNSPGDAEDLERTMILDMNPIHNKVRVPVRERTIDDWLKTREQ